MIRIFNPALPVPQALQTETLCYIPIAGVFRDGDRLSSFHHLLYFTLQKPSLCTQHHTRNSSSYTQLLIRLDPNLSVSPPDTHGAAKKMPSMSLKTWRTVEWESDSSSESSSESETEMVVTKKNKATTTTWAKARASTSTTRTAGGGTTTTKKVTYSVTKQKRK